MAALKSSQDSSPSSHVKGGSLIIQELSTGIVDIYEVEEIALEAVGYIGLVYLKPLTRNLIDNVQIVVPSNVLYGAIDQGILKVYNPVT